MESLVAFQLILSLWNGYPTQLKVLFQFSAIVLKVQDEVSFLVQQ